MGKWKSWFAAVAVAVAAMVGTPALAQNLVTNPGFETGSFSGWTVEPATGGAALDVNVNSNGRNGTFGANLGATESVRGINQTIATQAGKTYTFSFYVRGDNGGTNAVSVFFGSNNVYNTTNLRGAPNFNLQSFNVIAGAGNSTVIRFAAQDSNAFIVFDDISVAAVPEAATWLLMILGFGIIGWALRRRRGADVRHAMLLRA